MWCRRLTDSLPPKGCLSTLFTQQQHRSLRQRGSNKPRLVAHGSPDPVPGQGSQDLLNKERRKAPLTKMLDNAGTFDDYHQRSPRPGGTTLPTPDPFLSSPYTKETKIFTGGANAVDEANRRHIVDPATTSVMLFPGQGTQYVGMCGDSPDLQLFSIASDILGFDLLKLCREGPIEQLNQTVYSQAAILVCSLSAVTKLEKKDPIAIDCAVSAAGFSVGEYAALVFAGIISFEDAVRLVKIRSQAMQIACDEVRSLMATVLYGADSRLPFALEVAREWATRECKIEDPICTVASHLFPHCKVIAGHAECIEFLLKNYQDFKLRKVKVLQVSGAFHTDLMKPAEIAVRTMLKDIDIQHPRIPVFSNVTGHHYSTEKEVRRLLPKQIVCPVLWEQTLHTIFERPKDLPYPKTYEIGPGKSLRAILKYANLKAQMSSTSIQP